MLIGPDDNFEKQFGSGFREGNISKFINHQQMESLELFEQALESLFLPALHELGHEIGGGVKAYVSALGASGKRQGADQMGFAGSALSSNSF